MSFNDSAATYVSRANAIIKNDNERRQNMTFFVLVTVVTLGALAFGTFEQAMFGVLGFLVGLLDIGASIVIRKLVLLSEMRKCGVSLNDIERAKAPIHERLLVTLELQSKPFSQR